MSFRSIAALAVVVAAARAGGAVAARLRQPRVLGELAAGLVLGNLVFGSIRLAGVSGLGLLETGPLVEFASRMAVIVLLFHASVESTVGDMKTLGLPALLIAACGIAGSFAAAWGMTRWLLPSASPF